MHIEHPIEYTDIINEQNDVIATVSWQEMMEKHLLHRSAKTNGVFHYEQRIGTQYTSLTDTSLRQAIYTTVRNIPHDGSIYMPCYGEFYLIDKGVRYSTSF